MTRRGASLRKRCCKQRKGGVGFKGERVQTCGKLRQKRDALRTSAKYRQSGHGQILVLSVATTHVPVALAKDLPYELSIQVLEHTNTSYD